MCQVMATVSKLMTGMDEAEVRKESIATLSLFLWIFSFTRVSKHSGVSPLGTGLTKW